MVVSNPEALCSYPAMHCFCTWTWPLLSWSMEVGCFAKRGAVGNVVAGVDEDVGGDVDSDETEQSPRD